MKILKPILLIIVTILFTSCSQQKTLAPDNIEGKSISFYTTQISGSENQDFLDKYSVYSFQENRKFEYTLDGKNMGGGSYSYSRSSSKNRASLIAIYTTSNGEIYTYEDELIFQDAKSGTWEATRTNDPALAKMGKGTFKIFN